MNKKIEIQKIKVNNGRELIAKVQEYKSLGGEWKLRENYFQLPAKKNEKSEFAKWGIVIGNNQQVVEIYSENNEILEGKKIEEECLVNVIERAKSLKELGQIFPEINQFSFLSSKINMDPATYKRVKKEDGEHELRRLLVAENSWHLKQILHQYVRDNETKIYQSANPHFSGWVEIIDGKDGNMYLYVGQKNDNGGREIKIGIRKSEFEKDNYKEGISASEMLALNWNLFTIDRPKTPVETHEYYSKNGGLEEEWQRNWPHRGKLCRKYLEDLRDRLSKRLEYWKNQPNNLSGGMCMPTTTMCYIESVDYELDTMKKNRPAYYAACDNDCSTCGVKLCCHYEGKPCEKGQKFLPAGEYPISIDFHTPHYEENDNHNQLSEIEQRKIEKYFRDNSIYSITLDGDKLLIIYNDKTKRTIETNNQELQLIKSLVQKQDSKSLNWEKLTNVSHLQPPKKSDYALWISLGVGIIIVGGIIAYLLAWRKRK